MIFGTHDSKTLEQFRDVASRAVRAALMADGHFGYVQPIGGVTAYDNAVSIAGVGVDIGCGNDCIRTNLRLEDITSGFTRDMLGMSPTAVQADPTLVALADEIFNTISFGMERRNNTADDAPVNHKLFEEDWWSLIPEQAAHPKAERERLRDNARKQLGTVGGGNHYVDVLVDEDGYIWVGVHFGSRGFGFTVAHGFVALHQNLPWGTRITHEQEGLLSLDTPLGSDYFALMHAAGTYAFVGRNWVAHKVVSILGGVPVDVVSNHHNFAWKEFHRDEHGELRELVVVRKGATPAFPGQRGFVGGSMGDDAVILAGAETRKSFYAPSDHESLVPIRQLQEAALFSTVHGAGRVMGRAEAVKGKVLYDPENPSKVIGRDTTRRITPDSMQQWLNRRGVILRGGNVEEAPQAYRRLDNVLAAQGVTINVLHRLRPLIVCMAPKDTKDDYKD